MTQQLTVVGSIQAYGGSIYQTVTSSMLKANSSGQIIAAVGGTDYEYPLTFSSPLVRTTNTISIPAATTSVNGYLTSTDWNTFNNKGSGTVTSVTGTAPVVSSGGTTPAISMAAATTSVSGYLTSTDWNTFNGKFTLPSLTSGSVLFSNGSTIAQNNNRLYWDNTNMRLGIGTQSVSQYVTYIAANVGENANAWLGIENKNTTGSTAVRLLLNGSTTSGFQYVQSTNMTQVYANAGDIQLINGSSLGLTIANTTGAATFDSSATATSFVKTGGTSSQFLKADGSVDSTAYGTITSVTATAPVVSSGGTTPVISMAAASGSVAGYVTTGTQTIAGAKTFSSAAIFSSTINSGGSIAASGTGNITLLASSSDNFPLFQLTDGRVGGKSWNIENGRTSAGLLELYSSTVGTVVTITQAGAGTFSSTLQATKIGIGGAPSAFILDVTGTAKVSGVLTLGGGTGGLNFTSSTSITNTGASGYISIYANGGGLFLGGSAATTNVTIASGGLTTFTNGIGVNGYNASINYAALFSGSVGINNITPAYSLDVTGTGRFTGNLYTQYISVGNDIEMFGGHSLYLYNSTNTSYWWQRNNANTYELHYNAIMPLSIASTGAATFSSTIDCVKRAYVSGGSTIAAYTTYTSAGSSTGYFGVDNSAGNEFIAGGSAYAVNIIGVNAYPMIFGTNNTEKMRITSGGNVGIGTVSPSYKFVVSNGGAAGMEVDPVSPTISGGVDLLFYNRSTSAYKGVSFLASQFNFSGGNVQMGTSTYNATYYPNSGTNTSFELSGGAGSNTVGASAYYTLRDVTNTRQWLWQIDASFNLAWFHYNGGWAKVGYQTPAGTWTNSDIKRKKDFENVPYGLKEILQLNPQSFRFIKEEETAQKSLGFIAQEVLPIIPEAVQSDMDGEEQYYAMNYQNLVPVLVKAIQEQQATIISLQDQINELKNK